MKKFSSLFLSILMVLSIPIFAFGSTLDTETSTASLTSESPKFNIKLISDNHIDVSSKDGVEHITVTENSTTKKVTIYNVNSGQTNYFLLNKKNNSIYSSLTNKTIKLSKEKQDALISQFKSSGNVSYYSFSVSYARIRSYVGAAATAGSVVGLIVSLIPGAELVGGAFSDVCTIVAALSYTIPNDSSRGLKISVKKVKHYRWRAGKRRLYKVSKFIIGVRRTRL